MLGLLFTWFLILSVRIRIRARISCVNYTIFENYQDLKGWYLRKIPEVPLGGPRLMPPHIYDDCERTRK